MAPSPLPYLSYPPCQSLGPQTSPSPPAQIALPIRAQALGGRSLLVPKVWAVRRASF